MNFRTHSSPRRYVSRHIAAAQHGPNIIAGVETCVRVDIRLCLSLLQDSALQGRYAFLRG